jgi:hypothetical protein
VHEDVLRFVVDAWFLEIVKGCIGILTPEIFEAVDLSE